MTSEIRPFDLRKSDTISLVFFTLAFWFIPLTQLNFLEFIPGDIGDSRLNNYFLENIYQFFFGSSDSLWHLPFFAPFSYVGGFSDNHFGSSFIYIAYRLLGEQPFDAFQLWFLSGYAVNFFSAYYVLRRLGGSTIASSLGALVFAFAFPTTAHANHVQLHYRFGIPLSLFYFSCYCIEKTPRHFWVAMVWLVWQLYAGIYMGFFTAFLLFSVFISSVVYERQILKKISLYDIIRSYFTPLYHAYQRNSVKILLYLAMIIVALVVLFFPYLMVKLQYGFGRGWSEISLMMPRLQSYLISDVSIWWGGIEGPSFNLPLRHEHQMFPGLFAVALGFFGVIVYFRNQSRWVGFNFLGASCIVFVLTLSIFGYSLWFLLHKFPIVSAIRAVCRVDQALLFPLSYFVAIGVDYFIKKEKIWFKLIPIGIAFLLLLEYSSVRMPKSAKSEWDDRLSAVTSEMPEDISMYEFLFVGKDKDALWYAHELDAMWAGMTSGLVTLNGYSGNVPPGYSFDYGRNCVEIDRRIEAYNRFAGDESKVDSLEMKSKTLMIGFQECEAN